MARIRTIKPSFFASLSNANLPIPTRLTWIGLWTYVDDKGRAVDDARLVRAAIWPLDEGYTTKKVEADLVLLEKAGKIGRYVHDGQRFLAIVKWRHHQRIDKPQPSTIPPAPWEEDSGNVPGTLPPDDGNGPGAVPPKDGGEVEGKGSGRESSSSAANRERSRNQSDDDDDDDESKAAKALAIVADRRIDALAAPPANRRAYRAKVLRDVDAELGDELRRLAGAGLSADAIADAVEPPKQPVTSPYPSVGEPSEPVWDEVTDEHGHLVVVPRRSA